MKTNKKNTEVNRAEIPFIMIKIADFAGLALLIVPYVRGNYISRDVYKQLQGLFEPVEATSFCGGIYGTEIELVNGDLSMCGRDYKMLFWVANNTSFYEYASKRLGVPVCGVIGAQFMSDHNWELDYDKKQIVIPDYDSDYSLINYN